MAINVFLPQVTRIPITGPAPYNTLVCVSAESYLGPQQLRDGELTRFAMRVSTPFRLAGFDQRVRPMFDHSTTAWISSIGPIKDGNWIYAVDSVSAAGFTPTDGTYFVDLMAASSPDGNAPGTCTAFGEGLTICFYFVRIQVTSWLLCFEPPITPPPVGHVDSLNNFIQDGISTPELVRISTDSPPVTATADHARRVLEQFSTTAAVSVSEVVARNGRNGPQSGAAGLRPTCG